MILNSEVLLDLLCGKTVPDARKGHVPYCVAVRVIDKFCDVQNVKTPDERRVALTTLWDRLGEVYKRYELTFDRWVEINSVLETAVICGLDYCGAYMVSNYTADSVLTTAERAKSFLPTELAQRLSLACERENVCKCTPEIAARVLFLHSVDNDKQYQHRERELVEACYGYKGE